MSQSMGCVSCVYNPHEEEEEKEISTLLAPTGGTERSVDGFMDKRAFVFYSIVSLNRPFGITF